ncbi:MAG: branched-chain amino acid ABC transporter permease, partial [Candidatus Dormibacteraeota bacterium]|nr:branched-chain amino acid ABC transporter permease [Candidatus Dormibacteraeota bacterium]
VSLGQAAFYAIGAYTAGLLATRLRVAPAAALLLAPLVSAAIAALIGVPLLRLRGHYLAFATLAFQLIVISVIHNLKSVTRGDIGLSGIPSLLPGGLDPNDPLTFCFISWFALAAVLVLSRNLVASRPGRALRALATSEAGASAAGVPVGRYKLQVFALAGAYAGLAGGIYAFFESFISPASFPILLSVQFLVMAVVGGVGVVWGSVIGAVAITLLLQVLKDLSSRPGLDPHAPAILQYAVYALILILVMLFLPDGLLPALRRRLRARRNRELDSSDASANQAGGGVSSAR